MKKVLINALKIEQLSRLSIEQRGKIVKQIKDQYNMSYRDLEKETGINKSTLQDWVSGRQRNDAQYRHISILAMICKLKHFTPNKIEYEQLKILNKIVKNLLKECV